jgi:hypothetical protein
MKNIILNLQQKFDNAELHADTQALSILLTEDFISIGPRGFILDKTQWINRHKQFKYYQMETTEVDIHLYEKAAVVRNIQRNKAVYNGKDVNQITRVAQVWVEQNGEWRMASIQFSPMSEI